MGPNMKRISDASRGKIASMEHRLSGVLRPIKPSKEFVRGISLRIRTKPRVAFVDRIANWRLIAILIAGLVSLTVFMAVLGRALLSLVDKKRNPENENL
jgi:hypothetical protein